MNKREIVNFMVLILEIILRISNGKFGNFKFNFYKYSLKEVDIWEDIEFS